MAVISFKVYIIDKSIYLLNPDFKGEDGQGKLVFPLRFSAEIGIDKSQEKSYVLINIDLGESDEKEDLPFNINQSYQPIPVLYAPCDEFCRNGWIDV